MAEPVRFQHFEVPLREDGSLHELGRGAMGITYKAFDTNLRCFVALKVINAAYLSNDTARQRFLREARAAAALRHPNVATVFHLGEEGGDCFYAMEFVDGETVEALMKREGSIPVATALEIVLQVSRALGAAHKQELVHRDIKPSNLMIVHEDEGEFTVKVIDFGLAKNSGSSGTEDAATLTMGGFLGTPHFASPEQLEERDLDVRSDIYSLGVTLFYMLAGRAPFSGSLAQVMSQHLHREPPLETLSDQPPPVVKLLKQMLAKDPADRPQTPVDLRHEVEACLEALKSSPDSANRPAPVDPDNFETQVLDSSPADAASEWEKGSILAGRYRLIEEVRASDFGRLFKAESLETSESVAILVLDPSLLASSEACTRIEDQVMALQKLSAPALQKIYSLERLENNTAFLVLEWVDGPSLLDLMRTRKALPASEALPILRSIASGFDALQSAGIPCPDIASHEVMLCGADISRPVTAWINVAVKFNPISPGSPVAPADATLVTSAFARLVESGVFSGNESRAFVYAVGSLAYEMLGGVRGGGSSGGTVPIPGLPETANLALRHSLDPAVSFASTGDFLLELEANPPGLKPPALIHAGVPKDAEHSRAVLPPLPIAGEKRTWRLAVAGIVIGLVLLLLAAGGGLYLYTSQNRLPLPAASPTPTPQAQPSPVASTDSPPGASSSSQSSPPPLSSPAPQASPDPVAVVLEQARKSAAANPAGALALLVNLLKSSPDSPDVKEALAEFLAATREHYDTLKPGQIAAMTEPLESAAAFDYVDAQLLLGKQLRETDPKEALKWTLAAANNSNTEAMLIAGLMLSNGLGAEKPNLPEAAKWFEQAAEKGDPRAMFAIGECYLLSKGVTRDPQRALGWINKAAGMNDVQALNKLGDIYTKGIPGIVQPDLKKAFANFSSAKDLGYPDAFGNLGALFMTAPVGLKDEKMAVDLFRQGTEMGDARSMYFYAMCLEEGLGGIPSDKDAARNWYLKAAELGIVKAQDWCRKNQVPFTPPVHSAR